jgi:hypothetical protein
VHMREKIAYAGDRRVKKEIGEREMEKEIG